MPLRITLIRHARSTANDADLWEGRGDSPLSEVGHRQVEALGRRLAGRRFDLVVSSDLERARQTARVLGDAVEVDPAWREMDLGGWEGKTFDEVRRLHPDLLQAIRRGEALAFGGTGETLAGFESRVGEALDRLVDRVDDEAEVAVVTHGGVIDAVVGRRFGRVPGRRTYPIVTNTSLTVLENGGMRIRDQGLRVALFNDATHLGVDVGFLGRARENGVPVLAIVRHGVTRANKEGRIQGRSCWGLDEEGRSQAARLAAWYGSVDRVISSPIPRAMETASVWDLPVEEDEDLAEMAFGDWEGFVFAELFENGDATANGVYRDGVDLPRGGSGETFADLLARTAGFLQRVEVEPGRRTVAVSHGAAIRAMVSGVLEMGMSAPDMLSVSANTGVSHVVFDPGGPMLADYSLAPHLEAS